METPDTEWERDFGEQLEMRGITGYVKQSIIEDVRRQRSSRDTYWKERVRNEQRKYNRITTLSDMFDFGYALGRESVLKEMAHDQQIFTDGFSHPIDCEECRKKV